MASSTPGAMSQRLIERFLDQDGSLLPEAAAYRAALKAKTAKSSRKTSTSSNTPRA